MPEEDGNHAHWRGSLLLHLAAYTAVNWARLLGWMRKRSDGEFRYFGCEFRDPDPK